ncbi:Protoheme IX farnesyltransferase 2 [Paraliobacillus sp. PM-2]|uniref:heme o synthase n=1 Tax=Paraliobacillus sp. PM-2 TaxID=1462524 RepID=UPI00061B96EB|nr:heme o synthase [Paraliobacillus sp. PM-2]CQR47821.1 Protoheme IX farnesyltransferase 2 [Paraliobacillus sp. PM-2]
MQKIESVATDMLPNSSSQDIVKTKRSSDLKALFKTGIIQSNVMTALAGFLLALYQNQLQLNDYWFHLVFMLLGSAFVIAGGCVLNNYYDRDIDPVMSRTKKRPTVTGTIPLSVILILGIILSIVGVGFLLAISWQAGLLGLFGWFAYVVLYTMWSKRRYTLNTAIGSLSGAVPPLIGWAAIDPNLSFMAFVLFALIFVWQTPHFLALAIKKNDEYQAANIPMLPVVHGFEVTKRQIIFYIVCLLPIPFLLYQLGLGLVLLGSALNIGWLILSLKGLKNQDTYKWANKVFVYSLFYLLIIFVSIIMFTLPFVI